MQAFGCVYRSPGVRSSNSHCCQAADILEFRYWTDWLSFRQLQRRVGPEFLNCVSRSACLLQLFEGCAYGQLFCVGIDFIFSIRPSDIAGCSAGVICKITKKIHEWSPCSSIRPSVCQSVYDLVSVTKLTVGIQYRIP